MFRGGCPVFKFATVRFYSGSAPDLFITGTICYFYEVKYSIKRNVLITQKYVIIEMFFFVLVVPSSAINPSSSSVVPGEFNYLIFIRILIIPIHANHHYYRHNLLRKYIYLNYIICHNYLTFKPSYSLHFPFNRRTSD